MRRLLVAGMAALGIGLVVGPIRAQQPMDQQAFTNLTNVDVTQISNAVRVTFTFDGAFHMNANIVPDWALFVDDNWPPTTPPVDAIKFRLTNARTQAGAFFDVSRYPVSHVEMAIPPGAPDGVGLDVAVVLTQPARFRNFTVGGDDWCCIDGPSPSFDLAETQDHRQLIVTILSDRLPEQPELRRTAEQAAAMPHDLAIGNRSGVLSVHALNVPIAPFAQALSEATGVPITVDDAVERVVNAHFPAVPLDELLDDLRRTYGLAIVPDGIGFRIADATPLSATRFTSVITEQVPLRYVPARAAADLFPVFLRRFLRPDTNDNGLLVTGSPALVDKVRADVERIDRPVPQIDVEVVVAEISATEDFAAALTLSMQQRHSNASTRSDTGDVQFGAATSPRIDWSVRLPALEAAGRARIVSRVRERVQSGGTATLFAGANKLIPIEVSLFNGADVRIQPVDVGAQLEVTPWTGGNGDVTLRLKPSSSVIVSLEAGLPTVDTRSAQTTVRAHTGETIAIGGLRQRSRYVTRWKIPLLGDLPFVGGLFRSRRRSRTDDDLVFFVTPRVVVPSGDAPDHAAPAPRPPVSRPTPSHPAVSRP